MNTDVQQWAERLFQLRRTLKLDQQQMGELLGVSREWVSKLENSKGEFSKTVKSTIELHEREAMRSGGGVQEEAGHYAKTRNPTARTESLAEPSTGPMVNPRHEPVLNPTPQACLDYFEQYLARARRESGGIGYAWRLLQKHFPLDEFEPSPPKKENP